MQTSCEERIQTTKKLRISFFKSNVFDYVINSSYGSEHPQCTEVKIIIQVYDPR